MGKQKRIPVILDTDIGGDIDDTWAFAMLLRSPELDLRLVTTATGDTEYRAKIVARLLEVAGRTDVPVGVGLPTKMDAKHRTQLPWVADYDLGRYPGKVQRDGVAALVEAIMSSPEPVTLVAIGPLTNVAAALAREPRIADRARFVGMHGCVRRSHGGKAEVIAEYNVKADAVACQRVFAAPWEKTITPLDTCGLVRLTGEKYRAVAASSDPLARAVIGNYEVWKRSGGWVKEPGVSSILFDCVAVYLAFSEELLAMRRMKLSVTDDGFTREDPAGSEVDVALDWKGLGAFEDLLVARLIGEGKGRAGA
jgi:inosine-uridine nucleoside N-ribohydrolase